MVYEVAIICSTAGMLEYLEKSYYVLITLYDGSRLRTRSYSVLMRLQEMKCPRISFDEIFFLYPFAFRENLVTLSCFGCGYVFFFSFIFSVFKLLQLDFKMHKATHVRT